MTTIEELLERGRAAYTAAMARVHTPATMPLGIEGVSVVTRADYLAHPGLCLQYAVTARTLQILDPDGRLEVLMCPVKGNL